MKLVLFSDLHLDSSFAWMGVEGPAARRRREAQRETFERILELAVELEADALLCGGDLYEDERVSPDSAAFLCAGFEKVHPLRVFLAPGNHDWFGPASVYRQVDWSPNVHVFTQPRLVPVELADGVTLWGAAHGAPAGTEGFLDAFRVDRGGIHLALFHGAEGCFGSGEVTSPHAPFTAERIRASGLHHAFLGHYHRPREAEDHTYPGNPEPLAFGEDGRRGAVFIRLDEDGSVEREWYPVASTELHDLTVDVTGSRNRQDLRHRVTEALETRRGVVRVTLEGRLAAEVDLRPTDFDDLKIGREAVKVRLGSVQLDYDLDAIACEPTVRGQFVRNVRDEDLADEKSLRVVVAGLRALDGRADLEVP